MKKNILFLMAGGAMLLTGCKKLGPLSADLFTVTPTPLEANAGQVPATINGTFPVKYMKKKAVVTVTPVLKYEAGEAEGQSATFQGEKVQGNGTTISYKVGGNYTMKNNWVYTDEMLSSDLILRFDAKLGKKSVAIPEVKVGYGVVATSSLLGRCLSSATGAYAADAYQRIIKMKQEANIKFLISQATVRTSELKSVSIADFVKVLQNINDEREKLALGNLEVSAYASPDGKYDLNEKLAQKRQDAGADYLKKELKKIKMDASVDTKFTAEDWEGFQELINASNLQDKAVILRVLSMYQDPEQREAQIRNMSSIYAEIKEGILPELRRARLIVNYDVVGRSDEQIVAQFGEDASKLSVEEMLYGANLQKDAKAKQTWYEKTAAQYPSDYRAFNNLAQLAIQRGDVASAQAYLNKAQSINRNAVETNTNLALVALAKGDAAKAETYLAQGTGADAFNEVLGALNIAKGNYPQAAQNLSATNNNTAALAKILNKDYAGAKQTLAAVKKADATTSYLKAVLAARTSDASGVATNLRDAIQKDSSLAQRAVRDLEFAQYESTVKALVK